MAVSSALMALYSLLLVLASVVAAPFWLLRIAFSPNARARYREGLGGRLGRVPADLRAAVAGRRVVWLHAVSVGEVLAATRLVKELEEAFGADWVIVISTTTATGQALARERFGSPRVFWYPLDFGWAVRAYLHALQPELLVLMESELWPRMLVECGRRGVPVAVVNARVSDRSYRRGVKVKAVWGWVLRRVTLFLAQSEEDGKRLVHMGAAANRVRVVGNLKYDVRAPKESRVAELIREAAAGRPIVVAGSTVASTEKDVDSEEAQVVYAWMNSALPRDAVLILAPRHPERFREVWEIAFDFPALKATDLLAGRTRGNAVSRNYPDGSGLETMEIILLDTIGDLAAVYGLADVAYIGGSMMRRGGHNPLEPAQYGVPVVMGSSYENFREIVSTMIQFDGIRIIKDEVQLAATFEELLINRDAARAMGERGRRVFEQQQGATGCAVAALLALVNR